jgi:catecholate siderophore receptor
MVTGSFRKFGSIGAREMAASLAIGLGLSTPAYAQEGNTSSNTDRDHILVEGQKQDDISVDRVTTSPVDTPQTVSTISSAELEERGIANLNDALRNVAGLSLGAGETSYQGNNAYLRGFSTRNDLYVDNARDYGYYYRDTFADERIEVLKGPSSILFGRGATGGVIHRVSKVPLPNDFAEVEGTLGSADKRRIAVDLNAANALGQHSAVRLNAVVHHSGFADRDEGYDERWAVAPELALGMATDTRILMSFVHQEENNRPDYGIPWIAGTSDDPGYPAPVDRSNYYGFSNDRLDTVVNIATGRIEHDVNDHLHLRSQLRYSNNTRDFRYTEAIVPAGTTPVTPLESVQVSRTLFEGSSRDEFLQSQTEMEAAFGLAGLRHTVVAGIELGTEASNPIYVTNVDVPGTSLVDPEGGFYDSPADRFVRLRARNRSRFVGVFGIDTIELADRWLAIIGARWDSFHTHYTSARFLQDGSTDRDTDLKRTDRRLSYRGAIVYKPRENGSIYLSYSNSFDPSGQGIESLISSGRAVGEANIDLSPETSWSVEMGSKWNLFDNRFMLTGAIFRIQKDNVRVPDPDAPGFNTLGGKQRVDGFEVGFDGRPLPRWTLHAAYSYLDSETLESTPGGPLVGRPLALTPRHSGSFSTSYDITDRLTAGVNLVVSSSRLGNNQAARYLIAPGYTVIDLNAAYRISENLTVRVFVNNITDKLFYDQLHSWHVIPGAGRTAAAELKVTF